MAYRLLLAVLLCLLTPCVLAQSPYWEPYSEGLAVPYVPSVSSLVLRPDGLIVAGFGGGDGFARSSDGGITWEAALAPKPYTVYDLSVSPEGLFLAAGHGALYLSDDGLTWDTTLTTDHSTAVSAVLALDDGLALVGRGQLAQRHGAISRSTDGGETWTRIRTVGFPFGFSVRPDGTVFASTSTGLAHSDDGGLTWTDQPGLTWTTTPVLFATDGAAYVGVGDYFDDSPAGAVYHSDDGAQTWEPVLVPEGANYFTSLAQLPDGRILAGATTTVGEPSLYVHSAESGWSPLPEPDATVRAIVPLGATPGSPLLLGTSHGLFRSEGPLTELMPVGEFEHVLAVHGFAEVEGSLLTYVVDRTSFEGPHFQGLVFRRGSGGAWAPTAAMTNPRALEFEALPSGRLVVVGNNGGTEAGISDDGGDTWTYNAFAGRGSFEDLLATRAGSLIAATTFYPGKFYQASDLYRSTDGGLEWTPVVSGADPLYALAETPRGLLAAGGDSEDGTAVLFRSLDDGQTWNEVLLPPAIPQTTAATATDEAYYLGASDGIWRSADDEAWERVLEPPGGASELTVGSGGELFAAGFPHGSWSGVYHSSDGGDTWALEDSGIDGALFSHLFVASDGHLYAGTGHAYYPTTPRGIYRSVEPVVTSDEQTPPEQAALELGAPHPNPSRGRVTFQFSMAAAEPVTLEVVDLLGRRVDVLVEEVLPAGTHRAVWEGENAAATGIYFGVLRAGDRVLARQFVRVRQ